MPRISEKGLAMPASPIRKLVPFAEAAKKAGKKVLHLNIGQPDIKTPEIALEAVRKAPITTLAYSRTEGSQEYREKIADYYAKNQIEVNADQIIVSTGGSEALSFAMGTIADPGDEIIIPEPFYANYNGFAQANGLIVQAVPSRFDQNFALPPVEEFEKRINSNTKAILICNPGNPTGYLYTEEEIDKLSALVLKHDIFLIADEVYREFAYDGRKHHSIMTRPELHNHAILIDSVSKRYSMCGARIGCLVSRNPEVIQASLKFAQARLSPPTLAQIASEAALDTDPSYFDEVIDEYVNRRNVLIQALQEVKGIRVARPGGAFYCIAELEVDDAERFAQWLLESFDIDGETVMVAPAEGFYSTPGMGKNQVRIAYVLESEKLKRAARILEEGVHQYNRS